MKNNHLHVSCPFCGTMNEFIFGDPDMPESYNPSIVVSGECWLCNKMFSISIFVIKTTEIAIVDPHPQFDKEEGETK